MTVDDKLSAVDELAIKKAGSIPTWRPYLYDTLRTGMQVTGCRTGRFIRGPRKGQVKFLTKKDSIIVFLPAEEIRGLNII